ncbi:hypothetical protein BDM02DRAFT_1911494 [Thelephora ganbajun]|uniref:Uncharacterized protein n=1 Tax=Thelephora ganbajun TaxID=370292 RepID=A0ACB6ZUU7_THEGA|nr:hypothetical protein BDM02DRAFT_1911494 [Thelephora ganbajun]
MKAEETTTQSATQPATYQMAIDPALQQQSIPATSYYPYSGYTQSAYYSQNESNDVENLKDALGQAGVDLRAEEENLQRGSDQHHSYRSYDDRTRKQPATPNFDSRFIGATMRTIGTTHKVTKIPEDSVNYLALALRVRLQELMTAMIAAAAHRHDTQFDRSASLYEDDNPMWSIVVRTDVAKQLAVLERIEREEEMKVRRERKERSELAAAQSSNYGTQQNVGDGDFDDDEAMQPKKKKKKEGPGVTARNMSEDVRKKMSNAVASQAAGLSTGKYAWMNAAAGTSTPPKTKSATSTPGPSTTTTTNTTTTTTTTTTTQQTSSWARPYVSSTTKQNTSKEERGEDSRRKITLRDALFVLEKERGHGGGRGSARNYAVR